MQDGDSLMQQGNVMAIIGQLVELTRKIARGRYDDVDELFELTREGEYPPEIVELAEAFGMMIVQVEGREYRLEEIIQELEAKNRELEATLEKVRLLQSIRDHLGKFVPCSVKKMIEDNPDNPDLEKRDEDVTIAFLDIAGYSKMSEQIEQSKVNYLIQTYFSSFLDVILGNKGDINETAGDGLMIIFRDPDPRAHAINAVKAAIGIQKNAARINAAHADLSESVTVNIGINSGLCSVGSTRFEAIAGTRWTFTASGPITNMAARIGSLASGGSILIGCETYARVQDRFEIEPLGAHNLKNISRPENVFRVCGAARGDEEPKRETAAAK